MEKPSIPDDVLLQAYNDAIKLELPEDFIHLLEIEIKIRGLVSIGNLTT
ncbi:MULTISPECIES: sporulation histidine kinase inhibitor Sda [Bacillaceae]|nr:MULTISPECIES: sporulation histidine kinase inhibitor Sda [Bacillaceae]